MKTGKLVVLMLFSMILGIGVCGCMKDQNKEFEISDIKEKVEARYEDKYTVEYFQAAKDSTYTNILTLSDNAGLIFNAYRTGEDGEVSDDYPEAILNDKVKNHILMSSNVTLEGKLQILCICRDGSVLNVDSLRKEDPTEIDLLKMIVLIQVADSIENQKENLFKVYKAAVALNPERIEYEVISAKEVSEELTKVIENPLGYYNNNWQDFKEIDQFIHVVDKSIASSDDLVKEVQ